MDKDLILKWKISLSLCPWGKKGGVDSEVRDHYGPPEMGRTECDRYVLEVWFGNVEIAY